jgi:hypothetical protein
MDYPRFNQTDHGFSKLTAVRLESGGWRRCVASELPHAIVARTFGPNTFAIVVAGEIDGLTDIVVGGEYGVGSNGDLTIGSTPVVGIGSRATSLVAINLSSSSSGSSVDLSGYQLLAQKGAANGYVPLGPDSLIDSLYLPDTSDEAKRRSWMNF